MQFRLRFHVDIQYQGGSIVIDTLHVATNIVCPHTKYSGIYVVYNSYPTLKDKNFLLGDRQFLAIC